MIVWNVRSLLNVQKLANLLQTLEDNDIQVACLCETWFDQQIGTFTPTIKAAGFEIKHATREGKKGGGAAILYNNKWIQYQEKQVQKSTHPLNTRTAS